MIERLTAINSKKKCTAPSVAEPRRGLGQRRRKITEYSAGEHVDSSINVHVAPVSGAKAELGHVDRRRALLGRSGGRQGRLRKSGGTNSAPQAILRDGYGKGAMTDVPVKGIQQPDYVREKMVIPVPRIREEGVECRR